MTTGLAEAMRWAFKRDDFAPHIAAGLAAQQALAQQMAQHECEVARHQGRALGQRLACNCRNCGAPPDPAAQACSYCKSSSQEG